MAPSTKQRVASQQPLSNSYPTVLLEYISIPIIGRAISSRNCLETLPVEILNHILSYLIHPRSPLPGLTECQSHHDFSKQKQRNIREEEDMTKLTGTGRTYEDLFSWMYVRHPFNVLAASSKRCHQVVESYCTHLVKAHNIFNLPFAHLEAHGQACVYPNMSTILYRRLWLQTAPRQCVFCAVKMSSYPHKRHIPLMITCENCFYAQALRLDEIQSLYHLPDPSILRVYNVRGSPSYEWALRIDVDALALKLYGTRAFHHHDAGGPCGICRDAGIISELSGTLPRRSILPVRKSPRTQRR